MEFLVHIDVNLPGDLAADERAELMAREGVRGRELIAAGALRGIWRIPGRLANISYYSVADADELHRVLSSLPLFPWITVRVEALATHPLGSVDVAMRSS